jgi:glucokinase
MKKSVIGIAIGGTKVAVSHAFYDGIFSNVRKEVFPSSPKDPYKVMKGIYQIIDNFNVEFDVISLICGGPLDINNGLICKPPHLPGFDNFEIVKLLKERYKKEIILLNDADACALAEYKLGAGIGSTNMAFLTFGTGIGAGLILNNKLFTGNNGMAGEIGHVRLSESGPIGYGKEGTVEGYCSGGNIALWGKEYIKGKETSLSKYEEITTKDIFYEATNNDKVALEIVDAVSKRLGQTISILVDILNLDRVVIGGIYPRNEELLKDKVNEWFKKETIKENYEVCQIVSG